MRIPHTTQRMHFPTNCSASELSARLQDVRSGVTVGVKYLHRKDVWSIVKTTLMKKVTGHSQHTKGIKMKTKDVMNDLNIKQYLRCKAVLRST